MCPMTIFMNCSKNLFDLRWVCRQGGMLSSRERKGPGRSQIGHWIAFLLLAACFVSGASVLAAGPGTIRLDWQPESRDRSGADITSDMTNPVLARVQNKSTIPLNYKVLFLLSEAQHYSWRYSMTACWCRLIQPATEIRRNWS